MDVKKEGRVQGQKRRGKERGEERNHLGRRSPLHDGASSAMSRMRREGYGRGGGEGRRNRQTDSAGEWEEERYWKEGGTGGRGP